MVYYSSNCLNHLLCSSCCCWFSFVAFSCSLLYRYKSSGLKIHKNKDTEISSIFSHLAFIPLLPFLLLHKCLPTHFNTHWLSYWAIIINNTVTTFSFALSVELFASLWSAHVVAVINKHSYIWLYVCLCVFGLWRVRKRHSWCESCWKWQTQQGFSGYFWCSLEHKHIN